jgi:putative transposase
VSRRVSPTDAIRSEIDALFAGDRDLVEVLEDVARLGARLIIQTAVEAEVDAFLGRSRYQRAATTAGAEGQVTATATAIPPSRPPPARSR